MGGLALGAATGLVLCWAVGAALLYVPGQTELRRYAQESTILSTLNREIPPEDVLGALSRFDALGALSGPAANVPAPDPAVLKPRRDDRARERRPRAGLRLRPGRGRVRLGRRARPRGHERARRGRHRAAAIDFGRGTPLTGSVVAFDRENDVAVVSVPGLRALAFETAPAVQGAAAALLGYPENGPYTAVPARVGKTVTLVGRDAYGRFPTLRRVTAVRGTIRSGNSGGPVVDEQGRVVATVFGGRTGGGEPSGYGVPNELVLEALAAASAGRPLTTSCVSR